MPVSGLPDHIEAVQNREFCELKRSRCLAKSVMKGRQVLQIFHSGLGRSMALRTACVAIVSEWLGPRTRSRSVSSSR